MPHTALNLVTPLVEQLRNQGPLRDPAQPDWQWIDANTASIQELAAVWRADYDTARVRVARFKETLLLTVPSRKHQGKSETRVLIKHLSNSQQRALRRLRMRPKVLSQRIRAGN